MPGATREYATNAARQRAYRQRQRQELAAEQEEARLTTRYAYAVQGAVEAALGATDGRSLAREVHRTDPFETLRALAEHFHDQAGTPRERRPWR
jgi:hypothetical protein